MSVGPAPNLAGGFAPSGCPPTCDFPCPEWCDPKYAPLCTNDCFELYKCCCTCDRGDAGGCNSNGGPPPNTCITNILPLSPMRELRTLTGHLNDLKLVGPPPSNNNCKPGVGDPVPPKVPDSSASVSQTVAVQTMTPFYTLSGIWITCTETGVTLPSSCSQATFYHNSSGTKHYNSAAGTGAVCPPAFGNPQNVSSGSGSGPTPFGVTITVTIV